MALLTGQGIELLTLLLPDLLTVAAIFCFYVLRIPLPPVLSIMHQSLLPLKSLPVSQEATEHLDKFNRPTAAWNSMAQMKAMLMAL